MTKYIFNNRVYQYGGEEDQQQQDQQQTQQQAPQEDYNQFDSNIFSDTIDNFIQNQQRAVPQNSVQDAQPQDQNHDSEFIKNLMEYDAQQPTEQEQRLSMLEESLKRQSILLDEYGQSQAYNSSPEGMQQLSNNYDVSGWDDTPLSSQSLEQNMVNAESGGSNSAVSAKGAVGAYQFMPETWNQYKPSADAQPTNRDDAQAAYKNYMKDLNKMFNGDQRKMVASYNYGQGNVQGLIREHGSDWEKYLPAETKGYLKNVLGNTKSGLPTKQGADVSNLTPQVRSVVSKLVTSFPGIVISSGSDGTHTANSTHYDGEGVDIGANSSDKKSYESFKQSLPFLKQNYGINYIDEGDHIHVSLSTKGKI